MRFTMPAALPHSVARPSVSIVVPVYNPGAHIDDCIASLLGQSMPAGELELIFVDDGSTDATPARLDALAAEHPHVRVEHIPNSGWPGRPRNLGLDLARGEYVYFVDNDDWLERDAVARLYATARQDGADIVIGKVVGHGKHVPRELFRENLHAVGFDTVALLGLLTPHKLFRRDMLAAHGIRFPEGRRRLEDHQFVVHAYFHAHGISVLADRPCYHWTLRDRSKNASYRELEPEGYYGNVREVLDLVCEHTEPGPFRDSLLTHWYRGKMLGRVGGVTFGRRDEPLRRRLVETVQALALERYDEGVHDRLAFSLQVRSALVRDGRYESLCRLADFEAALRARLKVRVRGDGEPLSLRLTATLGSPGELAFVHEGDRMLWRPPESLRDALAGADLDVTEALRTSHLQVFLRSLRDGSDYLLPSDGELSLAGPGAAVRPRLGARVDIEAAGGAAGAPLPAGDWEVHVHVSVAGFSDTRPLRRHGAPLVLRSSSPGRVVARWAVLPRPLLARRLAARVPLGSQPWSRQRTSVS
jgi:glycosyltransferase involved in cell wall biosynthesis